MSSFAALFGDDDESSSSSGGTASYAFATAPGGLDAPVARRSASNFVGLDNQGATCYMNSLLQTWFMTPEIRGALYSLDPESELHAEHMHVKDVAELRKLKSRAPRKVPLHLQKLFTVLQHAEKRSVTTSELTTDGFGWKAGDARIQHDLDALYNELVDAVQKSLVKTSGEKLVRRLLAVRITRSTVTLTDPPYRSPTHDLSFSLQLVNLKGVPDLTTALEKYFQVEHLDDGNPVYKPDDGPFAGQKVPADRVTELQSCPPILAISLNRTTFDMVKLRAVKMKDRFDCPLVLDMRPYFVGGEEGEGDGTKKNKRKGESGGDDSVWGASPNIKGWGDPGGGASSTSSSSSQSSKTTNPCVTIYPSDLKSEEDYARAKALSESALDEPLVYDLFAVVLHHGNSANSGHYTSYIRDTLGEGAWTPPEFKPKRASGSRGKQTVGAADDFEMRKFAPDAPLRLLVSVLVLTGKRDPGRKNLFTYDFGNLGSEIKKRSKGKKWAQRFPKKSWPSVKQFCRQCEDYFVVSQSHVSLKRSKEQCLPEIKRIWDTYVEAKKMKKSSRGGGGEKSNTGSGESSGRGNESFDTPRSAATTIGMTDEEKSLALIAQMKLDDRATQQQSGSGGDVVSSTGGSEPTTDDGWEEVSSKRPSKKASIQSPKRNKRKSRKKRAGKEASTEANLAKTNEPPPAPEAQTTIGWGDAPPDLGWGAAAAPSSAAAPGAASKETRETKENRAVAAAPALSKEELEAQMAADQHYAREKRFADDWGRWFWFNDHKVVPITLTDVENAAVGKDSSRMLVYRSRRLPRNQPRNVEEKEDTCRKIRANQQGQNYVGMRQRADTNELGIRPVAPEYWFRQTAAENQSLQEERDAYDRAINMVELTIHTPDMYRVHACGFYLERSNVVDSRDEDAVARDGGELVDGGDSSSSSSSSTPPHSFSLALDARCSISDLKQRVFKEMSERGVAGTLAGPQDIMLSEVLPAGPSGSFHLYSMIGAAPSPENGGNAGGGEAKRHDNDGVDAGIGDDCTTSASGAVQPKMSWANLASGKQDAKTFDNHRLNNSTHGVSSGTTLLAWSGVSLPSAVGTDVGATTSYQSGKACAPIKLRVIALSARTTASPSAGAGADAGAATDRGARGSSAKFTTAGQYDVHIPASYTLVETFSAISTAVGISAEVMGLHCIEETSSGRSSNHRRLDHRSAGASMIAALKIVDGSTLCVEREFTEDKNKSGYRPLAASYAKSRASEVTFHVVDMMSPAMEEVAGVAAGAEEDEDFVSVRDPGAGLDSGGDVVAYALGPAYEVTVNLSHTGASIKEAFVRAMPPRVFDELQSRHEALAMDGTLDALAATQEAASGIETEREAAASCFRVTDLTCRIRIHNPHGVRMPVGASLPDGPGELLGDEAKPFTEWSGLKTGDTVYVEFGRPLPPGHVAIRYFVVTGNLQTQSGGKGSRGHERWLHIPSNATVKMALGRMCSESGLSAANRRLREVNENGDLGKLCMDLERQVVKYASHGETLLLEEGKVPRKGVITLNMSLFVTPEERELLVEWHAEEQSRSAAANSGSGKGGGDSEEKDVSMLGSLVQGMKNMILGDEEEEKDGRTDSEDDGEGDGERDGEQGKAIELGADAEPGNEEKSATMEEETEDAFIRARRRQQECVFPLVPRDVKKSEETLLSLKALFVAEEPSLHKLAELRGFTLVDAKQLRIRELDKQTVPRYVFRDNGKSLSKVKRITGSKRLAIQLLAEPEQLSNHAKLYFVQHRDLEHQINSPGWPCNEITLDVGPNPSLANLHAILLKAPAEGNDGQVSPSRAASLGAGLAYAKGITDYKHLEIARWDAKTLAWRRVVKRSAGGGRKRKGKNGRRGGPARLTLQDGDLLAFADARTHPGKPEDIKWDREEDMLAQQYKQMAAIEKKQAKKNAKSGSSVVVYRNTRRRKAPVGDAKIQVYLGFSSSDEEDQEDGEQQSL